VAPVPAVSLPVAGHWSEQVALVDPPADRWSVRVRQDPGMVIVPGSFDLDPAEREHFLQGSQAHATASRGDDGCVEFTVAADSTDTGRVVYVERWRTAADLAAHAAASTARALPANPVAARRSDFGVYDAGEPRPL